MQVKLLSEEPDRERAYFVQALVDPPLDKVEVESTFDNVKAEIQAENIPRICIPKAYGARQLEQAIRQLFNCLSGN